MKISLSKQWNIKHNWNENEVLVVNYATKHSKGRIEMSIAFFQEFKKKIKRLLKGVLITQIYVYDNQMGLYKKIFNNLDEVQ